MMGFGLVNHNKEPDPNKLSELTTLLSLQPRPDILCLQEAGPLALKTFNKIAGYPHSHSFAPKGAVIYSKYPIIKKGYLDFKSKVNSCLWADIALPSSDTVRVYSVHLESTRLSSSSYDLLADKGLQSASAQGVKDLLVKYPLYAGKRATQAHLVKEPMLRIDYIFASDELTNTSYSCLRSDLSDHYPVKASFTFNKE